MKSQILRVGILLAVSLSVASCAGDADISDQSISAYVNDAVTIMDEHGLYRDSAAWHTASAAARDDSKSLDSIAAAYALLRSITPTAGGEHSFFLSPSEASVASSPAALGAVPEIETADGVSTLTLPTLPAEPGSPLAETYLGAGAEAITTAADRTTCGWVIDLSSNAGGNGLTMLDVVTPLLDSLPAAGFAYPDGTEEWLPASSSESADGLNDAGMPVALVTSPVTASAAELVLAAFDGQPNTVRVGQPSAGLTTSNQVFDLSDGAEIVLSTAWFMNRDGDKFEGPISPDLSVSYGAATSAVSAARDWVASTCVPE